jgi:hypothetical protein
MKQDMIDVYQRDAQLMIELINSINAVLINTFVGVLTENAGDDAPDHSREAMMQCVIESLPNVYNKLKGALNNLDESVIIEMIDAYKAAI